MESPPLGVGGSRRAVAHAVTGVAVFVAACAVGGFVLPNGLPVGVVLFGLLLGSLTSLTAMGLVILYRSARIINFAQAEIGGLSAAVAVVMVTGAHLPYLLALPVGLAATVATGAVIDLVVIRQLFQSPRLIVTVATIAVAQVVGAAELGLPSVFTHLKPLTTFTTPFSASRTVGPIVFNGDDFVAMLVVPVVLVGLAWFFNRTVVGVAIRGSADSTDRATLLGIPVRRLSTVTWCIAAGLSGVGAMLTAPILGPQIGLLGGPESLLAPLAAAVVARMVNLTTAFVASLGIGVFQQAVFWSYPRASTVDVALFVLVLGSLLLQRRQHTRIDESGLGGYVAVREVRAIPDVLRRLPEVRWARLIIAAAIAFVVFVLPLWVSDSKRTLLAYVAIYGIFAVSLVVLTGWSGQISLGQFAFAGVGAGTAASLFVHLHADLFVSLAAAAVIGAVTAVLIGIPATRLPGLFLAVTTLAFAVPVSTFLLNSSYFPRFVPSQLARPSVFNRIRLDSALSFYFFCLAFLIGALALAHNYRRTRAGRVALAVRDNARGAAAYAVSPVRVKLTAFALAGGMAGVAGGLYTIGLRGIGFSGFNPQLSLDVFVMVVIGGVGTLTGGLLGATYLQGVQYFLRGAWQLLATGGGLLLVVMLFPGGLADLAYRLRDAALRAVAARHDLSVPSLAERAALDASELAALDGSRPAATPPDPDDEHIGTLTGALGQLPLLALADVRASYGTVPVLFGVDLQVNTGDIVGLLGTNGSGKSTVLRVISGLLKAGAGRVVYDGRDVTRLSAVDRVKAGIVMVPSGRGVFPSLTVAENLRLGAWLVRRDRRFVDQTTERIFELFPALERRLGTPAGLLSGGEQQMLTIAQALYCRPRLLMIDELSLGLAPIVVSQLLDVIRRLVATGVTVVVVEQSVNVATTVAERSVFMERGQVRFTGMTADLAARPDLVRSVFLGRAASTTKRRPRTRPSAPRTADRQPTFAVDSVSRHFGAIAALSGVTLEVAAGEILGIIGANGAGKTTLFDICSGFLAPSTGTVVLGGIDVTGSPAYERADMGLGRVFQDARLFPSLTVTETIAVALERHIAVRDPFLSILHTGPVADSEADIRDKVDGLVARVGLERYRDAFVSELSTGTRRVVELAAVLAHDPSVLLLDEPTSGIAQREGEALGRLLLDLRAHTGSAFVIIEHDVPLVASIADRLVCMHLGEVIADGRPEDVLANPAVIAAYLGDDAAAIERSSGATRTGATRAGAARATRTRTTARTTTQSSSPMRRTR